MKYHHATERSSSSCWSGEAPPDAGPLDELHVLTTFGPPATKTIGLVNGEPRVVEDYGRARFFRSTTRPLNGPADLFAALAALEDDPRSFVVRGERLPTADPKRMRRLVRPKVEDGEDIRPTLRPKARWVLIIDMDDLTAADAPDPRRDPEAAAEYARSRLPQCFHRVACRVLFTAACGIKPGIRARLAFWLDQPLSDDAAARLLQDAPVDLSPLRAHMPNYTAAPIFKDGCPDPLPRRSLVLPGQTDTVEVPLLPPAPPGRRAIAASPFPGDHDPDAEFAGGIEAPAEFFLRDGRRGAIRLLGHECRELRATSEGGRNSRLNRAAFKAGLAVGAGLIGEDQISRALAAAALAAGLDEAEADATIRSGLAAGMRNGGEVGR